MVMKIILVWLTILAAGVRYRWEMTKDKPIR